MTKSFNGIDYDYRIFLEKDREGERYGFTIEAVHKESGSYSHITINNSVLSELGVNPENPNFENSTFDVSKS
jgi:hypothetical protein